MVELNIQKFVPTAVPAAYPGYLLSHSLRVMVKSINMIVPTNISQDEMLQHQILSPFQSRVSVGKSIVNSLMDPLCFHL